MRTSKPNFVLEIFPEDINFSTETGIDSILSAVDNAPPSAKPRLYFGVLLELKTYTFTILDITYVIAEIKKTSGNIEFLRIQPTLSHYVGFVSKYSKIESFAKILNAAFKNRVRFSLEKYCGVSEISNIPYEDFKHFNRLLVIGNDERNKMTLELGRDRIYSFSLV